MPESYALPAERCQLVKAMKEDGGSVWIVKPSYQACGQGIFITKRFLSII